MLHSEYRLIDCSRLPSLKVHHNYILDTQCEHIGNQQVISVMIFEQPF